MLLFLDTEYTDPLQIDLISIGLVSEDGKHEFYCERSDFDEGLCNGFVRSAVLPLLQGERAADRAGLRRQLTAWFAQLPRSVTIGCDSFTDYELLLDALDHEKPVNLAERVDLRPLIDNTVFHAAVCRYHNAPDRPWHHALHDARAHRIGWLAWNQERDETKNGHRGVF
jgi:hypothetical protein